MVQESLFLVLFHLGLRVTWSDLVTYSTNCKFSVAELGKCLILMN